MILAVTPPRQRGSSIWIRTVMTATDFPVPRILGLHIIIIEILQLYHVSVLLWGHYFTVNHTVVLAVKQDDRI